MRRGMRAFFCPGESKPAQQLYNMEGDGLGDWLKQTGREVARAAGSELKSVAKDRAAQYAREMIGQGLKEALGDAAGAVGKAAVDEAGRQGKHQAKALISKYFGGDGIGRPYNLRPRRDVPRRDDPVLSQLYDTLPQTTLELLYVLAIHRPLHGYNTRAQRRRATSRPRPL